MKQYLRVNPAGLLLGVLSSCTFAQGFGGHISVSSGESDNALKTEENKVKERQDTFTLGVNGEYRNEFLSATAQYTGQDQRFDKDSQEQRQYVDGASSIMLGSITDPVDLELKHSRRTILKSPDDLNISSNQDDREIISVIPRIKKRISNANLLILSADFNRVDYSKNKLNNSHRASVELNLLRNISRTSDFSLMVQQTDIEFENFSEADYRYINSGISFSTQLRKLAYSLSMGYNQSKRNFGNDYGSPTYVFNASYVNSLNAFKITSSLSITDSSMGGGNFTSVNLNPNNDGAFNVGQIERTNTELSWSTQTICTKCTVDISFHANKDDYLVLPDELNQLGGSVSFAYAFSRNHKFLYRISEVEQEFSGSLFGGDYVYKTQAVEFHLDISKSVGVKVFYEREARESDYNNRTYIENFIGAAVFNSF